MLGGVAVHEGQIWRLSAELDAIQSKYFPQIAFPIAFHASEIRRCKGHFEDFAPHIRKQMLKDVYDAIKASTFPNLVAFATAIHIKRSRKPSASSLDCTRRRMRKVQHVPNAATQDRTHHQGTIDHRSNTRKRIPRACKRFQTPWHQERLS